MKSFNVGDKVKFNLRELSDQWDDVPEDIQEFIKKVSTGILLVRRVVTEQSETREGEYILAYQGFLNTDTIFYNSELILVETMTEWDN
jgi:hypothetical protein